MQMFLVGGAVRDQIMGRKCKDYDFSVVLPPGSYRDPFEFMCEELEGQGYKIFTTNPEFLTARARTPDKSMVADFVLARRDGAYTDGRRPDTVEVGTLYDDIARRDFTMNSLALAEDGSIIDYFGGQQDIREGIIRTVGDPMDRFTEDSLRILRALRFSVTLGFEIDDATEAAMDRCYYLLSSVSKERINDELSKMFAHSTTEAVDTLFRRYRRIGYYLMGTAGVRLMPTLKEK